MNDRQELFGDQWITAFCNGDMFVAALDETGVSAPIVGHDPRLWCDDAVHEAAERTSAPIRHNGKPDAPGITSALPLVEAGAGLALAHLDRAGHKYLIVDTAPLAARATADQGFIGLHVCSRLSTNPILIWPHHAGTKLVKNLKGRLVARKPKLPLELHGRDAVRLTRDQIGRPKPHHQRRVSALHHRSRCQARVVATPTATKDTGSTGESTRLADGLTVRARKSANPARILHVGYARGLVWEQSLERRQRTRKWQIIAIKNVHDYHHLRADSDACILHLGVGGDSRISTLISIVLSASDGLFEDGSVVTDPVMKECVSSREKNHKMPHFLVIEN